MIWECRISPGKVPLSERQKKDPVAWPGLLIKERPALANGSFLCWGGFLFLCVVWASSYPLPLLRDSYLGLGSMRVDLGKVPTGNLNLPKSVRNVKLIMLISSQT